MDQCQPTVETSSPCLDGPPNGTLPEPGDPSLSAGEQAAAPHWGGRHFINVRLSIPLIFMRIYVTLVVGKERRSRTRRRVEREKHPLGTLGNTFFFSSAGALISLATLAFIIVATVLAIRHLFDLEITLR